MDSSDQQPGPPDGPDASPDFPKPVVFRLSLAGLVMGSLTAAFVAFIITVVTTRESRNADNLPYQAAVATASIVFFFQVVARRRQGIRVDQNGIADLGTRITIGWSEISAIRIENVPAKLGARSTTVRVARVSANDGRSIAFLEGIAAIKGVARVLNAPLLLAIIADRSGNEDLFPPSWRPVTTVPLAEPIAAPASTAPPAARRAGAGSLQHAWGLLALAFKLVPKLLAVVLKLFKTIKPGMALATVGVYSLIFSWKFAVALVVMIGVHECGHVYAMWRCGIPVQGIYFIPFFGGVALGRGIARTRREEAYIAANGPVWGTVLAFACFAAYEVTGERYPVLAAAGAWGALINLFNLLPILPLDGGRLINNLAYSFGTGIGSVAVFASLVFGGVMAYWRGFGLLVLMVVIGLVEFVNHLAALPIAAGQRWLRPQRAYEFEEHDHFAQYVSEPPKGSNPEAARESARQLFEQRQRQSTLVPMTRGQSAFILAVYAGLAGALMWVLHATADLPGHGNPIEFLQ